MASTPPFRRRRYRARRLPRAAEWRQMLFAGALAGLVAFNFLPGAPPAMPSTAPSDSPTGGTSGAVVRVIDGDTFDYLGERIRIADIDTPELRAQCAEEGVLARRATARLRELLASGPFELSRVDRDEDRYGRKLRIVTRGGRSIGDMLVAEGLARTWTGRREPWC